MQLEDLQHLKTRDFVSVNCTHCEQPTQKLVKNVRESIRKGTNLFCSRECHNEYMSLTRTNQIETECFTCGKTVHVKPSSIKERNYCSKRCAAITNNSMFPKRVPTEASESNKRVQRTTKGYVTRADTCGCGHKKQRRAKRCRACAITVQRQERDSRTIGSIREYYIGIEKKRLGSVSHTIATLVRKHARTLAAEQAREKVCRVCGYSTYVELCHIKPISEFPDEATLLEINGPENTVYLCPNHHKELDLSVLPLSLIS